MWYLCCWAPRHRKVNRCRKLCVPLQVVLLKPNHTPSFQLFFEGLRHACNDGSHAYSSNTQAGTSDSNAHPLYARSVKIHNPFLHFLQMKPVCHLFRSNRLVLSIWLQATECFDTTAYLHQSVPTLWTDEVMTFSRALYFNIFFVFHFPTIHLRVSFIGQRRHLCPVTCLWTGKIAGLRSGRVDGGFADDLNGSLTAGGGGCCKGKRLLLPGAEAAAAGGGGCCSAAWARRGRRPAGEPGL